MSTEAGGGEFPTRESTTLEFIVTHRPLMQSGRQPEGCELCGHCRVLRALRAPSGPFDGDCPPSSTALQAARPAAASVATAKGGSR